MITTFKEGTNGFYCAECRMSFAEPLEVCPYCGSIVSNYEELITPEIIIGGRWYEESIEEPTEEEQELWSKLERFIKGEFKNESNIHRTN